MKKITIAVGLYLSVFFSARAQEKTPATNPNYQSKKLKTEEINFVTSYYHQNGNNSAVTGGIGTEKLTDFGNTIDLKWSKIDGKNRKHSFTFDMGVDTYTSASSDKINPNAVTNGTLTGASSSSGTSANIQPATQAVTSASGKGNRGSKPSRINSDPNAVISLTSASYRDTRVYPTLGWSVKDDKAGTTFGVSGSVSTEYDYKSVGGSLNFTKTSKDNNREIGVKINAFFDTWSVILPVELRPVGYGSGAESDPTPIAYKPRHSYSAAFSLAQVINSRLQVAIIAEPSYQEGLLSTPYHRVYFTTGSVGLEKLPGTRMKLPVAFRANYFLGDKIILRSFYRYYQDDWGMKAHTVNLETSLRLSPFLAISPFYRFHAQSAIDYFAPCQQNTASSEFHTSDFDLSALQTHFLGAGFKFMPLNGVMNWKHFNALEIRLGHYMRSTGLVANSVTLAAKFK
jgi:hypothetical protein